LRALISAADRFFAEYRSWPCEEGSTYGDRRYGLSPGNRDVVNALRAAEGPGNPGHRVNPHRIDFLEASSYLSEPPRLTGSGDWLDPWGTSYQMVFDSDLDNFCSAGDTIYNRIPDEGVIAWSCGPDGRSDTQDDILSWR
jgi:hypothetical protein